MNIENIVGSTLPNGAVVRAVVIGRRGDGVVLAENSKAHRVEYVTWLFYRGDLRSTESGNYFLESEFKEAKEDFFLRAASTLI